MIWKGVHDGQDGEAFLYYWQLS